MTDDGRATLVAFALAQADELDGLGKPGLGGLLRRLARELVFDDRKATPGCRRCGAELEQPGRGRRRLWCSERCRKLAGNASLAP